MKLYCGIDLHSNNSYVVVIDENDRIAFNRRLPNDLVVILAALAPFRKALESVAVESTFNWYWLVDGLMEAGYDVKLVNTVAVKKYDGLKYTDDKHDARHLAHLLRLGTLPTGHIYPKEERAVRDLLRKRAQLVRVRTAQILTIQSFMDRHFAKRFKKDDIFRLNDESIDRLCGDPARALMVRSGMAVLRRIEEQVKIIEKAVLKRARLRPVFKKLLGVAGIGDILAMTIMYEAGSVDRFRKVGCFASYARCVDSGHWSNHKKKGKGNRKNGNKYLAWAFVEAAIYGVRYNERIRRFYDRKRSKRNRIVAIKAVAHKLARACYHVLRNQADFDATRAFR